MKHTFWTIILIIVLAAAAAARADSIRLRSSVRIAPNQTVVQLKDVATLEGSAAEALADITVLHIESEDTSRAMSLSVADVRRALRNENINWGRVTLSGRQCVIRPAVQPAASSARPPTSEEFEDEPTMWASQLIDEPTLRGRLALTLSREWFRMPPADVELLFDTDDEADLKLSTADYSFELLPAASPNSRRLPIRVNVFKQDQVVQTIRLTVMVRLRQDVLVVRHYVGRNERFSSDDIQRETRMLEPHPAPIIPAQTNLRGMESRKRLVPGQILREGDIGLPVAVKRNQIVQVRARHGGIVLRMDVRALDTGRVGDVIRVRHLMSRQELMARIDENGELVALGGATNGGGS